MATAQTELYFATGVDSTGRALAQSNADGHVLVESPQYPRGLWLHLVDEAGDALVGIQVEYQGRPDSLVAIRCVDPTNGVQETLIWTRPEGDPLRLTLKPSDATDLPVGVTPIDWQIGPIAEALLELKEETRLEGWEAVAAFLWKRWHDRTGRVAVRLDASTLAFELEQPEDIKTLVDHLQQTYRPEGTSLGERPALYVQVFRGGFASLREGVILYLPLFEDSTLERFVRQALGRLQNRLIPEDHLLKPEEVAFLTELPTGDNFIPIRSLVGLEHLISLQWLTLYRNRITDITPLAQLKNLETLNLGYNQITDITPLTHLTNLERLGLELNHIADLTSLASLNNLESLDLYHNELVDITPLTQLKNLNALDLSWNQITDITPLIHLTNLNTLSLSNNQITDITPLIHLTNLTELSIVHNELVDITPLVHLTNLNVLILFVNQITDVTPLAQLKNLETLNLSYNQITDVTPLTHLTNLQKLYLHRNRLVDLTPLTQLKNLNTLSLNNNQITDVTLTPLAQLKNLETLNLGYNQITDVTPLTHLTNLQELYLHRNELVDLTPLTQLKNLNTLSLNNNQIEDISPLIANTSLDKGDEVDLSNNPLSAQALNEHIPALQARGVKVRYYPLSASNKASL